MLCSLLAVDFHTINIFQKQPQTFFHCVTELFHGKCKETTALKKNKKTKQKKTKERYVWNSRSEGKWYSDKIEPIWLLAQTSALKNQNNGSWISKNSNFKGKFHNETHMLFANLTTATIMWPSGNAQIEGLGVLKIWIYCYIYFLFFLCFDFNG